MRRTSRGRARRCRGRLRTDNVGVTGYDVLSNGTKVASVTTAVLAQSGLTCGTSYTFAVVAYDAAGNRSSQAQLVTSTSACATAPPPSGVVELSGSVSPSTVVQKIAAAPAGPVTVRSASGGTATITGDVQISRPNVTLDHLTVNGVVTFTSGASGSKFTNGSSEGFDVRGADNVTVEGDTFDGKCQRAQNWVIEEPAGQVPNGTTIRNNTFRNYYMCSDSGVHTEALFIAYSDGGVIEGQHVRGQRHDLARLLLVCGCEREPGHGRLRPELVCAREHVPASHQPVVLDSVPTREPGVGEHERRPDFELVGSCARRPDDDRGRGAHEELLSVVADSVSETRVACPVRGTQRVRSLAVTDCDERLRHQQEPLPPDLAVGEELSHFAVGQQPVFVDQRVDL